MNHKPKIFFFIIFASLFFAGFIFVSLQDAPKKYNLVIVKVKNDWKVADETDYTKTRVSVKKKEIIIWTAKGTDAYLQFPGKLFNAVDAEDSLKNGYTKFLKDGKKLKLKVKDDALPGTYEYAVFCTKDGTYATGDSPPRIVIQ
jgi:hypothetical protein